MDITVTPFTDPNFDTCVMEAHDVLWRVTLLRFADALELTQSKELAPRLRTVANAGAGNSLHTEVSRLAACVEGCVLDSYYISTILAHGSMRVLSETPAQVVDDLIVLLSNHLTPIEKLDNVIYRAVAIERSFSLDMAHWHGFRSERTTWDSCGTTHCRAGAAVAIHPLGKQLEAIFGSALAGAVIYKLSTSAVPDFFAETDDAWDSIVEAAIASGETIDTHI